MPDYEHPLYRPPSEARSLIFQATIGCSHNRCAFCYMYKDKQFRVRPWEELKVEIEEASRMYPDVRRIFLADGDAMAAPSGEIERILGKLASCFPRLQRVTAYASPSNLLRRSVDELKRLRERGLSILYYGVESGDPEVLEATLKGATPDAMAEGCARATRAGIKLSVTVILGLAGREGSLRHARKTAELVNRIEPRYLSALTLMLGPHREGFVRRMEGAARPFTMNDALGDIRELREMLEGLNCDKCIFRSNHASNHLALAGTLQKDRARLVSEVDRALREPGRYLRDEWMRGL